MSTTFTTFEFYTRHGGRLTEAMYNAVVDDAYAEILSQTNGRALTATETMQKAVKLCECALVDVIAAYKKGTDLLPKGVGSISNDGYTVSVGAGASNPVQAEMQERRILCVRYLQWPENLMCRWL